MIEWLAWCHRFSLSGINKKVANHVPHEEP